MTKKKKIVIGIVALILAISLIATALIVILTSKFKIKQFDEVSYSKHTTASVITLDAQYQKPYMNNYYQNGTQIISNNNNKLGLFSNVSGQIVVTPAYDRHLALGSNEETNKSYFKFYNTNKDEDGFLIFDEHGKSIFSAERNNNSSYTAINKIKVLSREIEYDDDYDTEEVTKAIEVKNISYLDTYYKEGVYYYESWEITDKNNNTYTNIYDMSRGRHLVQTLGSSVAMQIDDKEITTDDMHFLRDGEIVFVTQERKITGGKTNLVIKIYDEDLELENTAVFENASEILGTCRIGNSLYLQRISTGHKDKYDFENPLEKDKYYNLTTYEISLKSGKVSEENFDYIITNIYGTTGNLLENVIDIDKALVQGVEINDKTIDVSNPKYYLVDKYLNTKEISYTFNNIIKISKNRYLASNNNSNYMLINRKYEIIADLSKFTDVFTTKDCIIASDQNNTYICNHDGMILNKYEIGSIINVHHKDYFLYRKSTVNDGEAYNLYYKGTGDSLSLVYEDCVSNNASDKLSNTNDQNTTFNDITSFIGKDYAYLLTRKNNGSTTTYKIYNFDGQALCSFDLPAQSISQSHFSLDNHVIIRIGSISILLNK